MRNPKLAAVLLTLGLLGGTTALAQKPEEVKDAPQPKDPAPDSAEAGKIQRESRTEGQELDDKLVETRLNIELLTLRRTMLKNQLSSNLQMLMQYEFSSGMGGMGGGIGGGYAAGLTPEDAKKQRDAAEKQREEMLASMRENSEKLRSAALETNKELFREQRRAAEFDQRINGTPDTARAGSNGGVRTTNTSVAPPNIEQRLKDVEQKLDRVLTVLEGQKRGQPASR